MKNKKRKKKQKKKNSKSKEKEKEITYEIIHQKDNLDIITDIEKKNLENEINLIFKESSEAYSSNSEQENESENNNEKNDIEDIKKEFIDENIILNFYDYYSEKGKIISSNTYDKIKGSLNKENIPFIAVSKNLKDNSELIENANKIGNIGDIKNDNKYNNKPPYNFNKEEDKKLDNKSIEVIDEDLVDYRSENNKKNYWYKKFKYLGKTYVQMTKEKIEIT